MSISGQISVCVCASMSVAGSFSFSVPCLLAAPVLMLCTLCACCPCVHAVLCMLCRPRQLVHNARSLGGPRRQGQIALLKQSAMQGVWQLWASGGLKPKAVFLRIMAAMWCILHERMGAALILIEGRDDCMPMTGGETSGLHPLIV